MNTPEGFVWVVDLATKYNCDDRFLRERLKFYNVPFVLQERHLFFKIEEAEKAIKETYLLKKAGELFTKEDLEKMFVTDRMSDLAIANKYGLCEKTISDYRKRFNIERKRIKNIEGRLSVVQIMEKYKVSEPLVRERIMGKDKIEVDNTSFYLIEDVDKVMQKNVVPGGFINIEEMAKEMNLDKKLIKAMIRKRNIEGKKVGKMLYYPKESTIHFLRNS